MPYKIIGYEIRDYTACKDAYQQPLPDIPQQFRECIAEKFSESFG